MLQGGQRPADGRSGRSRQARRHQCVGDLEVAGERQVDFVDLARRLDLGALPETVRARPA